MKKFLRPWGHYNFLKGKIKEIFIAPGQRTSLQSHNLRDEIWIPLYGVLNFTKGNRKYYMLGAQFIKRRTVHRIWNQGKTWAKLLEIQLGEKTIERDIVRYEDDYGRVNK